MSIDLALEIAGFSLGLLYLWWEYHADARLWLASVVMPAISMWIYFRKGLYADFGINIYYLAIAAYGYWAWTRSARSKDGHAGASRKEKAMPVRHIPFRVALGSAAVFAVVWAAIYLFLSRCTDSNVPLCDAFTTALSIVALWLLARKYAEQWLAWMVVDAVCVGLYIYKGIPLYAALYAIYTGIAAFGYRKWLDIMKQQNDPCNE